MNENFNDSKLQTELGIELGEAVKRIRNSNPDASRVQSSVAAMESMVDVHRRVTLNPNRHAANGVNVARNLSWISILTLTALVSVGLVLFFSVPKPVTAAQIARSIATQDWVRATETFTGGAKLESWFSPSLNVSAISNGERIEYRDHELGESYEFFHESETIFRVSEFENPRPYSRWSKLATCLPVLLADGLPNDPMNNLPGLNELKERIDFLGHSIEPADDSNELKYEIQCLLDKAPFEFVFFIDAKTKLPVRSIMTGTHDGKEMTNTIELTYPDDGPKSIYDLGVPTTAKLVNRIDSGMGKFLRDAVYAGIEQFDDYRAVMVEHRVGDDVWWLNARVELVFQKGDCFTRRYVSRFERTRKEPDKGGDIHAWWERQVSLAHGGPDGTPYNVVIGEDIWDFDSGKGTFEKRRHGNDGFHCWSLRPDMIARPPMGDSSAYSEIRIGENPKSGPAGTILYELVHTRNKSVSRYWIDPNQGYLVVQFEMGTDKKWETQTIVEKAAQSPKGVWYPARLRSYWRNEGKVYEDVTNCYLDFESEIPDQLFEVEQTQRPTED